MKITGQQSDDAILRELGSRLAAARLSRNQTQAALADEAGVSKRTVERLESGEVAARLSGFVRVCRALGIADRLDALVAAPAVSPVELLKLTSQRRQRASRPRTRVRSPKHRWTWGGES